MAVPGMTEITNYEDIIDSRDVIARIEYLTEDKRAYEEDAEGEWTEDEETELSALTALASEAIRCSDDWEYGESLIRDSYFEEYAQLLAEDLGLGSPYDAWPMTCIDWERAALDLQSDYNAVQFGDVTYWIR